MTPFGQAVRRLRKINKITLKQFAADMGVSSAYFSALEHGYRGRPGPGLVQQIAGYFTLGMEETDELKRLAALSHPRVTVDTAGLNPKATDPRVGRRHGRLDHRRNPRPPGGSHARWADALNLELGWT